MLRIGIDLGGTKIEGVVLEAGRILFRKRIPTEQEGGYEHILGRIRLLYEEMAAIAGGRPYTFGIGTPGALSRHTGLLKNSNTLCLNGRPLKADLERLLGRRVEVQNDANCFAMAEALQGAGTGKELVFGVILGTGCGGGIVMNGQVRTGPQAIAGEWGHMRIDPNGPLCYCGQRGCVETYISGGGLEARYKERFGEALSFVEIAERYRRQEADAVSFLRDFFENFGRAMANLVNILDPDVIVLGGGLSNMQHLYAEVPPLMARHVLGDVARTPIVQAKHGDSSGVFGAARLWDTP